MENEYKFVSKFVEGKTYKELTAEEIEKLKSGVGVKKEDKEYIDSLGKNTSKTEENENDNEIVNNIGNVEEKNKNYDKPIEELKSSDELVATPEEIDESKKGLKVIQARGNILVLENNRTVTLTKKKLEEKPFWRKGDVYYG